MPSPDLGKRYTCFKCSSKFYDLNKPAAICPKCGADQRSAPQSDPMQSFLQRYQGGSSSEPAEKKGARGRMAEFEDPEMEDLEENLGDLDNFDDDDLSEDFDGDDDSGPEETEEEY